MDHPLSTSQALERLARENAELRGDILATGVILAQMLQSICKTQLNPHAFATKIMKDAREAVEGFKPDEAEHCPGVMKAHALETIRRYDEQIKSVLPV